MKVWTFRAVKLQSIKWAAVSFGATLLFCSPNGFAQTSAKSETKKETPEAATPSTQPQTARRVKEPEIITNENGTITQADFRVKTAGVVRDSEQNGGPQTKTVRIWDACDPDTFNDFFKQTICIPG